MLSEKRFDVSVAHEAPGRVRVTVKHRGTGIADTDLVEPRAVGRVKERLLQSVWSRLCPRPNDVRIEVGRSARGTFIRVLHVPSGASELQDGMCGRSTAQVEEELLESLLCRLWHTQSIS
jgi:hypothetical protein